MDQKSGESPRAVSIPSLIGWLSLCLLAAALGRSLDERWQVVWAEMGAFGLAAAVGLAGLERVRQARQQRLRDRAMQARFECGLARLNQHSATIDAINAAVRKLARQVAFELRGKLDATPRNRRRDEMELVADYPIEIAAIDETADCEDEPPAISGVLDRISSRVVSFRHDISIPTQTVLLTFRLGDERLSFVVDVTWTKMENGKYTSGGTVLAVGVPGTVAEPAAAI
jgi:hypothetical protein